ncbi:MAG: proline dehydrogenase family protein [Candidatus Bathyarchaeia archaeon]
MSESASLWNGLLFQIAKHWIAGETYEEAMERAQQSNAHKMLGIINLLGEDVAAQEETAAATTEYLQLLKAIDARKIRSCISIKPTQLGLGIDKKLFENNLNSIVSTAKLLGNFVWIDMEGSPYTADTIDSYLELRKKFDNVGVAIQSYLKRSEEDVNRILDSKGMIRLVKGAYNEKPEIAFKNKKQINENFSKLMRMMFERGEGFAIATHDEKLIEEAVELSGSRQVDFEFEMLMGIRDKKKIELAQHGYRVSEYIPYGKGWWPYSVRRIREHKSNIFLLARSLVSG